MCVNLFTYVASRYRLMSYRRFRAIFNRTTKNLRAIFTATTINVSEISWCGFRRETRNYDERKLAAHDRTQTTALAVRLTTARECLEFLFVTLSNTETRTRKLTQIAEINMRIQSKQVKVLTHRYAFCAYVDV